MSRSGVHLFELIDAALSAAEMKPVRPLVNRPISVGRIRWSQPDILAFAAWFRLAVAPSSPA